MSLMTVLSPATIPELSLADVSLCSYGTFAWKSSFFDVEQGTVSELFDRPFYLTNTVIARVNSNDYYDESLTNKTGMHTNIVFFDVSKDHLENIVHSVSADFLNESTSYLIVIHVPTKVA